MTGISGAVFLGIAGYHLATEVGECKSLAVVVNTNLSD
jgi:hypothetical protein